MKYLQKKFSVPVAGPSVTQAAWDAIFRRAENRQWLDQTCDDQQPRAPAYTGPKTAPGGEMLCDLCGAVAVWRGRCGPCLDKTCKHQWTAVFTDETTPESYCKGSYRGYKIVGRRCLICDRTENYEDGRV
jgi:hypothetical protein